MKSEAREKRAKMSDMLATIIPQGLPIVGGGVTGFAIGFFLKKLLKFIILVIGFLFALIAFLLIGQPFKIRQADFFNT